MSLKMARGTNNEKVNFTNLNIRPARFGLGNGRVFLNSKTTTDGDGERDGDGDGMGMADGDGDDIKEDPIPGSSDLCTVCVTPLEKASLGYCNSY